MHTCGFRWGKNDGAPDVVGNINYPIIDRTYTAVCVNAPELKAFNEFFSSDYDSQSKMKLRMAIILVCIPENMRAVLVPMIIPVIKLR